MQVCFSEISNRFIFQAVHSNELFERTDSRFTSTDAQHAGLAPKRIRRNKQKCCDTKELI